MCLPPRLANRTQYDPDGDCERDDRKQHTFRADRRAGWKIMRIQIAACLLCLMLVGGSLDGLPDPPVVKPQGNQNNLVSQLRYQLRYDVLFVAKSHVSDCLASVPHFRASLFSIGQIFQNRGPSCTLTLVRQATDTSPPCFS